jgi:hypothetical protein
MPRGDTRFTISHDAGRLFINAPRVGPDKVELHPEAPDRFLFVVDDVVFTFTRTGAAVTDLVVHPPDQTFTLHKQP